MLACMPRPASLRDFHPITTNFSDTMSLALLPSAALSYSQPSLDNSFPTSPSPSKRPKLSLNTSNIAQGSTSLRLETLSATSPTAINTFQNRDNARPQISIPTQRPRLAPLATSLIRTSADPPTPLRKSLPDVESQTSPLDPSTSTTIDASSPLEFPYSLPINTTSILTNGPIPRPDSRQTSFAQSRPIFAASKRVAFRAPLTEDIHTAQFTLRHSDIIELESPMTNDGDETIRSEEHKVVIIPPKKGALSGSKRDSLEIDGEAAGSCPVTPVAGRAKRHRWAWTLDS